MTIYSRADIENEEPATAVDRAARALRDRARPQTFHADRADRRRVAPIIQNAPTNEWALIHHRERKSMSTVRNVAVLVGSLRKESFNRKMAKAMISMAPPSLKLEIVEIGQLPHYNQDHDADPPQEVKDFKGRIQQADAVLFLTPEYNRSVPGVLKNAIDVASRPYGKSAWDRKPGAVLSLSPGAIGAFGANHHLRQSLVFLNVPVMPQPEAYVGGAAKMFDEKGAIISDETRDFIDKFLQAFAQWIEKNIAG
jgi:chromate reductase, NAD(P)H dehydrogenase (quinone)